MTTEGTFPLYSAFMATHIPAMAQLEADMQFRWPSSLQRTTQMFSLGQVYIQVYQAIQVYQTILQAHYHVDDYHLTSPYARGQTSRAYKKFGYFWSWRDGEAWPHSLSQQTAIEDAVSENTIVPAGSEIQPMRTPVPKLLAKIGPNGVTVVARVALEQSSAEIEAGQKLNLLQAPAMKILVAHNAADRTPSDDRGESQIMSDMVESTGSTEKLALSSSVSGRMMIKAEFEDGLGNVLEVEPGHLEKNAENSEQEHVDERASGIEVEVE
ncbi:hypothetical protein E2P81_ATG02848 [Venturia nashicola]|nr:hypothetical protein E2P81_ATG02848 [Venturia nashicola]